jgi:transposase InsO family protein
LEAATEVAVSESTSAAKVEQTRNRERGAKRAGRLVARSYTPSERAAALERASCVGPAKASRELGISRFSLREWGRRQRQYVQGERKESPVEESDALPKDARDRRILDEWRAHPGLGPSQVRNQLRRAGFKVSVHTVRVVLEAHGYVAPKVRRSDVHDRRYEAVRPNQLWHLDFLLRHINKQAVYTLVIVDDYARFIVGHWLDDAERAEGVVQAFEQAVARHGRPESVMSDGGSAFWSWRGVSRFTRVLEEYGIDHLVAKVPQTNGKLEVLNANLHKELFNVERFFDVAETRRRLEAWIDFYNLRRTHHALGGILVPADRYFGRADRVLAEIEAGRSSEDVGAPLPVAARLLDLLRVTSQRGEVEVHLMGRRVWPAGD